MVEQECKGCKERGISDRLVAVRRVVALVQSFRLDLLVQFTVVQQNLLLCLGVDGRVLPQPVHDLLLLQLGGVLQSVRFLVERSRQRGFGM